MSSLNVRLRARSYMTQLTTPFFSLVNEEQKTPMDRMWCSLVFQAWRADTQTFCGQRLEEGEISLVFMAPPGLGDETALQQAEADAQTFFSQVDTSGVLNLLQMHPPEEYVPAGQTPFWGVAFRIDYQANLP